MGIAAISSNHLSIVVIPNGWDRMFPEIMMRMLRFGKLTVILTKEIQK